MADTSWHGLSGSWNVRPSLMGIWTKVYLNESTPSRYRLEWGSVGRNASAP
jgi:hypothetical protein